MRRSRLKFLIVAIPLLLGPTIKAQEARQAPSPIVSRFDPRLAELRRASAGWNDRQGPSRRVVDQVCLVPDVATFYEAIAAWDERAYFPILIDDVDLTLKFLHAFRPARVIRYPGRAKPIADDARWDVAVKSVGSAVGPTPPGVVLGRPESPSLPGLVALASGRFQPLVRLDSPFRYGDVLPPPELKTFLDTTETAILARIPKFESLGDDCDFITLAGDYPYRSAGLKGLMAIDDRVGRSGQTLDRWAFTGRLMGDARSSVYAAMSSLFLRPDSAMLFNSYSEESPPWSTYSLREAAVALKSILPVQSVAGERRATIKGWHDVFDPVNRHGLLFINTKGNPAQFDLIAGPAHALDVMPSVPAAVCIIHSYSAADPTNPGTIAGRWLAQGAFLYHGAVDEPYLNAFRPPGLVADLLVEGVPFSAAVRLSPGEPLGQPWKLTFLGDPLFRLRRPSSTPDRLRDFPPTAAWTAYVERPRPPADADAASLLAWAINTALVRETSTIRTESSDDVLAALRSIARDRLAPTSRAVLDELTFVLILRAKRIEDARPALRAIPIAERSAVVNRLAVSAILADLHRTIDRRDLERAEALWLDLIRIDANRDFKSQITARVAAIVDTTIRRESWRDRLKSSRPALEGTEAGAVVAEELKRIEEALRADRVFPGR